MERRIFADLDNTLIFSHRYDIGDRCLVEMLNGKEQAYMTRRGYDYLQKIDTDVLVPVTSRTLAQYQRVSLYGDGRIPEYALIDNGGILLIDGKVDAVWLSETEALIKDDMDALKQYEQAFSDKAVIKWQDDMVLFLKSAEHYELFSSKADEYGLMIFNHFDKIYVCSGKLTKGNAVRRFKARYPADLTIIAGDSETDLSMVPEADKAYLDIKLKQKVRDTENVSFVEPLIIAETIFGR